MMKKGKATTFSTIFPGLDSTGLFSPHTPTAPISNLAVSIRPPLCVHDGRRGPVGRLKPREIASDNEDSAGWIETATTLPTQVAAHFSFFGTDITQASQPATGEKSVGYRFTR